MDETPSSMKSTIWREHPCAKVLGHVFSGWLFGACIADRIALRANGHATFDPKFTDAKFPRAGLSGTCRDRPLTENGPRWGTAFARRTATLNPPSPIQCVRAVWVPAATLHAYIIICPKDQFGCRKGGAFGAYIAVLNALHF